MGKTLPYQKANCVGYSGFGGGYSQMKGRQSYCNICPLREECWDAHQERVRLLRPKTTTEFDELAFTHEGTGEELMELWQETYPGKSDPYTEVLMNNFQDGAQARATGSVNKRLTETLPWPFDKTEG